MKPLARWCAGASAVVLLSAAGLVVWRAPAAPTAARDAIPIAIAGTAHERSLALENLHGACVADMVANTCKVMSTSTPPGASPAGALVFIAGVGAIAAEDYQRLYAAGDAMCSVVREACKADWASGQCSTARKVFGGL